MKVVPGSNGGPNNVVGQLTATIPVTVSGTNLPVYIDLYFIAGTRVEAQIDFEDVGQRIDKTLQGQLVEVVAHRIATG